MHPVGNRDLSRANEEEDDFSLAEDALRNLSLSSDSTIDSLLSLDENPTPPVSPAPGPTVEVVDAASASFSSFRLVEHKPAPIVPRLVIRNDPPSTAEIPPTPIALRLEGVLPERTAEPTSPVGIHRTEQNGLAGTTFRSLRHVDGIGLGVVIGSPGETPEGATTTSPQLSSSPDYFGPAVATSPATTPSLGSPREGFRLTLGSLGPASPTGSAPPSPLVMRSSAFGSDLLRPRTPLTPSHVPGAPTLGAGGSTFEWFSFSPPASPISPVIRSVIEGN
ncbi:hypothetical protein RHOSPDRAFT_31529 [Rhodotorula sp. JG-1b]|nr:hypothetical protein RHOSPDRAFT_31529 [Rhodotorula sp. JG-1b]